MKATSPSLTVNSRYWLQSLWSSVRRVVFLILNSKPSPVMLLSKSLICIGRTAGQPLHSWARTCLILGPDTATGYAASRVHRHIKRPRYGWTVPAIQCDVHRSDMSIEGSSWRQLSDVAVGEDGVVTLEGRNARGETAWEAVHQASDREGRLKATMSVKTDVPGGRARIGRIANVATFSSWYLGK